MSNQQTNLDFFKTVEPNLSTAVQILEQPQKIVTVSYPIKLDNGQTKMITGYRIQFNDALGPFKGGLRFHPEVDQAEVEELAFLMALKTSLSGIPLGGGKGGVTINPRDFSESELERVARGFIREMYTTIGERIDIPAPDVNTTPQIMAWMLDEYEKISGKKTPGVITGKPLENGGSKGRDKATALGGFYILEEIFKNQAKKDITVAIQGFGNGGSHLANFLHQAGFKVVAVSDSKTGIYNVDGLNIPELINFKADKKAFTESNIDKITNEELLELEVDILIPAALGHVITKNNVNNIQAKLILETANAPVSAEADTILNKKGVTIIPDILANAGGVIVSYFEWVQNLQNFYWELDDVNQKLKKQILPAYHNALVIQQEKNISLRQSCYILAINRILIAEKNRGSVQF